MAELSDRASSQLPSGSSETVTSRPASSPPAIPSLDRFTALRALGLIGLTILLYGVLADAALETFLGGAAVRWLVVATAVAYAVVTALLWRRFGWSAKAMASYVVSLLLLPLTAWRGDGLTDGLRLFGQSTGVILAIISGVTVLLAGVILTRQRFLPWPVRAAIGLVTLYGVAAFFEGIEGGIAFPNLFHGMSIWVRLPFWLQGAFIGTLVLVPVAAVFQIATGLRLRGPGLRLRGLQVIDLTAGAALATAGLLTPVGLGYGPTETMGHTGFMRMSAVTFAQGESGSRPVGPAKRFQQGMQSVFAFVNFEGLSGQDIVDAVWYKGADRVAEQNFKMAELYGTSVPKKGYLRFILHLDEGTRPGMYFLEISLNNILAQVGILPIDPAR